MSNEDLQKKYERFLVLVKRLRHYTQAWIQYKSSKDYNNMTRYQREIDKWITDEQRRVDSKQLEIL
jgi:hypothetical protein